MRDLEWDTHTLPLGWSVQGIWPSGVDGSDINAVDRSRDYNFVASADDFGDVKIFNYPCTNTGSFLIKHFFFLLYIFIFHNNIFTSLNIFLHILYVLTFVEKFYILYRCK